MSLGTESCVAEDGAVGTSPAMCLQAIGPNPITDLHEISLTGTLNRTAYLVFEQLLCIATHRDDGSNWLV